MMKNILVTIFAIAMLALTACNSEETTTFEIKTPQHNGHYQADFMVLEGGCTDVKGVQFSVYNSVIYPKGDNGFNITGNAFSGMPFSGAASGSSIESVTFEGEFEASGIIGGEWSSDYCSGYFFGNKAGDITDEERYFFEAQQ